MVDTGEYEHWGREHWRNWFRTTLAHNTITIYDPEEKFYSQNGFMPMPNDGGVQLAPKTHTFETWLETPGVRGGKITGWYANPDYFDYLAADGRPAYSPHKMKEYWRQVVFLRPGIVIISDRVEATKTEFKKCWLMHFTGEPQVSGRKIPISSLEVPGHKDVPGHMEAYDGDFTIMHGPQGKGTLLLKTLLPEERTIARIGGPGYAFWNHGQNYPPVIRKHSERNSLAGQWRIELRPAKPATRDYFLNVIHLAEGKSTQMCEVKRLLGQDIEGVEIIHEGMTYKVTFTKTGDIGGHLIITRAGDTLVTTRLDGHKYVEPRLSEPNIDE